MNLITNEQWEQRKLLRGLGNFYGVMAVIAYFKPDEYAWLINLDAGDLGLMLLAFSACLHFLADRTWYSADDVDSFRKLRGIAASMGTCAWCLGVQYDHFDVVMWGLIASLQEPFKQFAYIDEDGRIVVDAPLVKFAWILAVGGASFVGWKAGRWLAR